MAAGVGGIRQATVKSNFWTYLKAAFNARPFGMFIAPNWIGLAAIGLLGLTNPGFWLVGAAMGMDSAAASRYSFGGCGSKDIRTSPSGPRT